MMTSLALALAEAAQKLSKVIIGPLCNLLLKYRRAVTQYVLGYLDNSFCAGWLRHLSIAWRCCDFVFKKVLNIC